VGVCAMAISIHQKRLERLGLGWLEWQEYLFLESRITQILRIKRLLEVDLELLGREEALVLNTAYIGLDGEAEKSKLLNAVADKKTMKARSIEKKDSELLKLLDEFKALGRARKQEGVAWALEKFLARMVEHHEQTIKGYLLNAEKEAINFLLSSDKQKAIDDEELFASEVSVYFPPVN